MGKVICVYHGNCADGFGAAWVVRKAHKEGIWGDKPIEFIPAVYGKTQPPEVTGTDTVVIVDFSFGFQETMELSKKAGELILLDHHASAINRLSALRNHVDYFGKLDIANSGAMLAWNFFNHEEPPQLLKHIEDRDLWKFALEGTRDIQANLFSWPYDFDMWDKLMLMDAAMLEGFKLQGMAITRKHFKDIHEFLNASTRWIVLAGLECPVVNCPYMWGSDAAHILAENAPNDFAAYYWDGPDGRTFGLRSVRDMDVAKIAENYGGGGHKAASGFRVSYKGAQEIEEESIQFLANWGKTDPYLQTR